MRDVIACDVDDILLEFYLMLALWHNERHGTNLRKEDFTSYIVGDVWGVSSEEAIRRVRQFYETEDFRNLPLVEGAEDGVRRLAEKYDLVAVTGRPHGLAPITEEAIGGYFAGCFKEIRHTDAFGIGGGIPRAKVDVCVEIGARIIIEDYLGHADPCADAGMDVMLFDQPWNRGSALASGVERVHSWDEILALLL